MNLKFWWFWLTDQSYKSIRHKSCYPFQPYSIIIWFVNSSLYFFPITLQCEFSNRWTHFFQGRTQWCYVFLQTQLQHITVQERLFGDFTLATLTFGPCTSPTDTFPFTYHFMSVFIPISNPLNCSPICAGENLQHFQCQINILDNPHWGRCSHFLFPYTLDSSCNNHIHFSVTIQFSQYRLSPTT